MSTTHCKRGHLRSVHMQIRSHDGKKVCSQCQEMLKKQSADRYREELRAIRKAVAQDLI